MKTISIPVFSDWLYSNQAVTEQVKGESFEDFSKTRLAGATAIAEAAKEKGGDALLTYEHFKVKLPYYKKAAAGKFNIKAAQAELAGHMAKLDDGTDKMISIKQKEFQRLVGIIEVIGELIIQYNATR